MKMHIEFKHSIAFCFANSWKTTVTVIMKAHSAFASDKLDYYVIRVNQC